MLRSAEFCIITPPFKHVVHLTIDDIKLYTIGQLSAYLSVNIKQSKTDREGKGVQIIIDCSGLDLCSVLYGTLFGNFTHGKQRLTTFLNFEQTGLEKIRFIG